MQKEQVQQRQTCERDWVEGLQTIRKYNALAVSAKELHAVHQKRVSVRAALLFDDLSCGVCYITTCTRR